MPLSDIAIRNANPTDKPRKLFDGGGLFLLINPKGGKWWRLKYRFDGKEKLLALGTYPDTSLALAREKRDDARKLLARGIDPSEHKKATKAARADRAANSFEVVAREWHGKFKQAWSTSHAKSVIDRLERDLFPWMGHRPISDIEAPELLRVLGRVEARGALETSRRLRQIAGQVFRYAIVTGRATRDPSADLKGAIAPPVIKHHAAITDPKDTGALMRAIEGYGGGHIVRSALKLTALTFVRSGELRLAEWTEFDLDNAIWDIPKERMKGRKSHKQPHRVPLSSQAVSILRDLYPLTGRGRLVFPGQRDHDRAISENTINASLRRMGYSKEEMTCHGFRAMARTLLDEQLGVRPDIIELQLAHVVRDPLGRAYNRANHWEARVEMMQAWADYLDELKQGAEVITIPRAVV